RVDLVPPTLVAAERPALVFFRTPPQARWTDVKLRFLDGHTVSVEVLGERGVFHYAQMGMARASNAEPTVQWALLRILARGRGALTWASPHADRRNQKRRERLARDLKA